MTSRPYKGSMSSGKASNEPVRHVGFEMDTRIPANSNHGVSQATAGSTPKNMTGSLQGKTMKVETNFNNVKQG